MKPWVKLDESRVKGGTLLSLWQRGDELSIRIGAQQLMGSRCQDSELALATLALDALGTVSGAKVLVAGLGFGYTLRATLDRLDAAASVVVAELSPAVVRWNRDVLKDLAGRPLEDPRVRVEVGDVVELLRKPETQFDVILLDVDNGPRACTRSANSWLYSQPGLVRMARVLRPGGVLAVWSAGDDAAFTGQLQASGYQSQAHRVAAREGSKARHVVWIAQPQRKAKSDSARPHCPQHSSTVPEDLAQNGPRERTKTGMDKQENVWTARPVRRR